MDQSKIEADARFIKDQTGFSSFEIRSLIQLLSCASSYTRRPFSKYGLLNWPIASFVLWRGKVHILVCVVFVTETRKRKSHSWLEKKLTWISMRWSKYTDLRFWKCEATTLLHSLPLDENQSSERTLRPFRTTWIIEKYLTLTYDKVLFWSEVSLLELLSNDCRK